MSSEMSFVRRVRSVLSIAYIRKNPWVLLRALVVVALLVVLVTQRTFWTPDVLLIILLVLGLVFGKTKQFAIRFGPFLGLLVVYDSMRSWADKINPYVNYVPMIDFDRWLFAGNLPTTWLQSLWWHGHVQWYDFYFYGLYMVHFLVPVVVALLLWRYREKLYWPFVSSMVILSFMAFFTYVAFPAAPPWMAVRDGYVQEPFTRISSEVWSAMGVKNFSQVYGQLAPNEVAAVPSLHSAYPLVVAVFTLLAFGWRRAWWIVIYPLSMWVGVVYLGEHYVFDIVIGAAYAFAACAGVLWLFKRKRKRASKAAL